MINPTDTEKRYFNEVNKTHLVTPAEETILAEKSAKGDLEARKKLVLANARFVISTAKKFQGLGLELSDLISEGNVGLIKAAERFDPSRGFKFISYAVWWIRQSILAALAKDARVVRLPMNVIGLLSKQKKLQEVGLENHEIELPEEIELEKDRLAIWNSGSFALNRQISGVTSHHDTKIEYVDLLCQNDWESVTYGDDEEGAIRTELLLVLKRILSEREIVLVTKFYGIGYERPYTLVELSEEFSISRERARQIIYNAVRKVRFNDELSGRLKGLIDVDKDQTVLNVGGSNMT